MALTTSYLAGNLGVHRGANRGTSAEYLTQFRRVIRQVLPHVALFVEVRDRTRAMTHVQPATGPGDRSILHRVRIGPAQVIDLVLVLDALAELPGERLRVDRRDRRPNNQ